MTTSTEFVVASDILIVTVQRRLPNGGKDNRPIDVGGNVHILVNGNEVEYTLIAAILHTRNHALGTQLEISGQLLLLSAILNPYLFDSI